MNGQQNTMSKWEVLMIFLKVLILEIKKFSLLLLLRMEEITDSELVYKCLERKQMNHIH